MQPGLLQVGFVSVLLAGAGAQAQHTGSAAPMSAPHVSTAPRTGLARPMGSPGSAAPTRNFAAPAGGFSPNRSTPFAQTGRTGHWPSWNGNNDYRGARGQRYGYGYPGFLSFGYGLAGGYGYDDGGGGVAAPAGAPDEAYGPLAPDPQMADSAPPLYRPAYQAGTPPAVEAPVHPQPATTLIFKDGRAAQRIHNYALTGTTLWDLDGEGRREISLDAIDIPATVKANREAGIDFSLPTNR